MDTSLNQHKTVNHNYSQSPPQTRTHPYPPLTHFCCISFHLENCRNLCHKSISSWSRETVCDCIFVKQYSHCTPPWVCQDASDIESQLHVWKRRSPFPSNMTGHVCICDNPYARIQDTIYIHMHECVKVWRIHWKLY